MSGILVFFHCPANTGYAIGRHEVTFAHMARELVGSYDKVHFGYPGCIGSGSSYLPEEITRFVCFDSARGSNEEFEAIRKYVREHDISIGFGFDQHVRRESYRYLREGGLRHFFSYWGAPMSSINSGPYLLARKLQYRMIRHGPDHYIFQSEDMRRTATHGVGIPRSRTSVVRSGVDTKRFRPGAGAPYHVHDALGIDRGRRVIYYSGHMEERKGVQVIVRAAAHLVNDLGRTDVHFVFLGNRPGEEKRFAPIYEGTAAEGHITFGGYRDDVAEIQASSYLAVIATTGWDSHTMTAVEVAASGLPLIVSDLEGIREAVSDETGFRFPVGDHEALGRLVVRLIDEPELYRAMSMAARARVMGGYTRENQVEGLVNVVRGHIGRTWTAR